MRPPALTDLEAIVAGLDPDFLKSAETLLDVLPDPVFVKDRQHRWVLVNQAFCDMVGRGRDQLYGKSDFDYSPPEEAQIYWDKDDEVFDSGESNINLELHTDAAGRKRVIETKKTVFFEAGGGRLLLGVIRDLTELTRTKTDLERANHELERRIEERTQELKASNAQLQSFAFYDPLTGLPNRRLLLSTVEQRLQHVNLGVFFVDLDRFKWMNDSKGHPFGDEILRGVANRFRELSQFSLVARLGGDEFIALAEMAEPASEAHLAQLARQIHDALSRPLHVQGHDVVMNTSIGIATSPRDGVSATELIQHADAAMYRAKDLGRDQFAFFDAEMGSRATEYLTLESGLRGALRHGELAVALQPIVDARTRAISGYEALARWHDPVLGEIQPDRFIPIAEASGLIHELGKTVLEGALQLAFDPAFAVGPRARLAVNVSARQLSRPNLLADFQLALHTAGFDPVRLELEITESSATSLAPEVRDNLVALRQLGVSIALDDFGTGYSSLAHLQRLPIDRVKIDRGFVADLPQNPRSAAMVEAMVRMSQALNLKVVAEGVEREDQAAFLTALGCDELQGFLFGRPRRAGA